MRRSLQANAWHGSWKNALNGLFRHAPTRRRVEAGHWDGRRSYAVTVKKGQESVGRAALSLAKLSVPRAPYYFFESKWKNSNFDDFSVDPVIPADFTAQHPFFYVVVDRFNGAVVAGGVVRHAAYDPDAEAILENRLNWIDTGWLGVVYTRELPWIYHADLEWIYAPSLMAGGTWVYHHSLGWCHVTADRPGFVYSQNEGWLFSAPGTG